MADKPDWQVPLQFDPDQLIAPSRPAPKPVQPAQQFALEQVTLSPDPEPVLVAQEEQRTPSKRRWRGLAIALTGVLGAVVVSEVYRLVDWGFALHPVLGSALAGGVALTGLASGVWLWKGLRGLRQLRDSERLHTMARSLQDSHGHGQAVALLAQLQAHCSDTPMSTTFKATLGQIDSAYNDAEVIRYVSRHALKAQDEAALRCLHRHSVQAGVLVALSPYATFDMWLVGWRNLKMLREITEIYGISPGAVTQWSLLKKVLHNIAFAGVSEMSIHAASHVLGSSLTSSLSARAGQGLGAGLFTARSAIQAIRLCRPLPLYEDEKHQLSSVSRSILAALKGAD